MGDELRLKLGSTKKEDNSPVHNNFGVLCLVGDTINALLSFVKLVELKSVLEDRSLITLEVRVLDMLDSLAEAVALGFPLRILFLTGVLGMESFSGKSVYCCYFDLNPFGLKAYGIKLAESLADD